MTLLFQQTPVAQGAARLEAGDVFMVLFGAGLAFLGATIVRLGVQAWRRRRPIAVPTRLAMPVVALLVLAEFSRYGRRVTRHDREWGSTGDWIVLGVSVVAVVIFVTLRMRSTARKLYVGGLALERGRQLARAALQAVAPDVKLVADDLVDSIVRLGKGGPGLQTQANRLLGVVVFKADGEIPDSTRAELFSGIARCLDAEELTLKPGLIVRVVATGVVLVVLGVGLSVIVAVVGS